VAYGDESWELDALAPEVMEALVRDRVLEGRDEKLWLEASEEDDESRRQLRLLADGFDEAVEYLQQMDEYDE